MTRVRVSFLGDVDSPSGMRRGEDGFLNGEKENISFSLAVPGLGAGSFGSLIPLDALPKCWWSDGAGAAIGA